LENSQENRQENLMTRLSHPFRYAVLVVMLAFCFSIARSAAGQSQSAKSPDLSGAWGPYGAGARGADPKLAPVAASPIVLKPEFTKAYEAVRAADADANRRGEPLASASAACVPNGMPTMMSVAVYPIEVIQTANQVTIIAEAFTQVRRIFMDKPQLNIDEVPPGYFGRSVGHWESDTLVVDTVGIKTSVQYQRVPHSDQMRITERIRLAAPDVLHDQITIQDPVVLEKPITYTLAYRRLQNYEMVEFVCDNNREFVDDKGVIQLRLGGR
jgi:hypothetical protein